MFCTQPFPYRATNDRNCDSYLRALHHQRRAEELESIRRQQIQRRYEYEAALALQRQREEEEARREAFMIREYQRQQQIQAHQERLRARREWEHRQHQIAIQRVAMAAAQRERMLQIQERERLEMEARKEWDRRRLAMEEQERESQRQWAIRQLLHQHAAHPEYCSKPETSSTAAPIPEPNAIEEEMDWETVAGSDSDSDPDTCDVEPEEETSAEPLEADTVPRSPTSISATFPPLAVRRATRIIQHHFRTIRPKLLALRRVAEDLSVVNATLSASALSTPILLTPTGTYLPQNNKPLAAYEETLLQLVIRADAVESNGVKCVRDARKSVVAAITARLEEVDAVKKAAVAESAESTEITVSGREQSESQSMEVDEQSVSILMPQEQSIDVAQAHPTLPAQSEEMPHSMDLSSSPLASDRETGDTVNVQAPSPERQSQTDDSGKTLPTPPCIPSSSASSQLGPLMSSSHTSLDGCLGCCRQEASGPSQSHHQAARVPVQT